MGVMYKSNIYQYFKILYGLVHSCFLGGGSSEDMEFVAGNCVFEFITLMHIMRVIRENWVVYLSTELMLSLLYIFRILGVDGNTYELFQPQMRKFT